MIDVLATVYRDGAAVTGLAGSALRLEFVSDMEAKGEGGTIPYYRYLCFYQGIADIRQCDTLQNVQAINPLTGQMQAMLDPASGNAVTWQVVDKPETFPNGHMELKVDDARLVNFS